MNEWWGKSMNAMDQAWQDAGENPLRFVGNQVLTGMEIGGGGMPQGPGPFGPASYGPELNPWQPRIDQWRASLNNQPIPGRTPGTQNVEPGSEQPMTPWAALDRSRHAAAGQGSGSRNEFDAVAAGQDAAQDYWQIQYDAQMSKLAAEEEAIKAQYSPELDRLGDDIIDLRRNAAAVGLPFDEYMAQRTAIGGDIGEVELLSESFTPVTNGIYDDASAEIKDIYDQIGVNLGPEIVMETKKRMDQLETTAENVIRTDEGAVDLLHEKTAVYASALAQAAYSSDIYKAMDAEIRINAELDFMIDETAEAIARQKKAMRASIDSARAKAAIEFQAMEEPTMEWIRSAAWDEMFNANGVNQYERQRALTIYDQIDQGSVMASTNEDSWGRATTSFFNQAIMESMGISNSSMEDHMGAAIDAGLPNPYALVDYMATADLEQVFESGNTVALRAALEKSGYATPEIDSIERLGAMNVDSFVGPRSFQARTVRDMYTQSQMVINNLPQIQGYFGPVASSDEMVSAPNGFTIPVAGEISFTNDWGNPRSGGRTHKGTDLMAVDKQEGHPILSPVDGVITDISYDSGLGGNIIWIEGAGGFKYYLAHQRDFFGEAFEGMEVRAGSTVGYMGTTGNARGTDPHLHFGIKERLR